MYVFPAKDRVSCKGRLVQAQDIINALSQSRWTGNTVNNELVLSCLDQIYYFCWAMVLRESLPKTQLVTHVSNDVQDFVLVHLGVLLQGENVRICQNGKMASYSEALCVSTGTPLSLRLGLLYIDVTTIYRCDTHLPTHYRHLIPYQCSRKPSYMAYHSTSEGSQSFLYPALLLNQEPPPRPQLHSIACGAASRCATKYILHFTQVIPHEKQWWEGRGGGG